MNTPTKLSEDDISLSGEYALGLLQGEALSDFTRRLDREPSLKAEVAFWESQFAQFSSRLAVEKPATQGWARIEQRLLGKQSQQASKGWLGWLTGAWATVATGAALALAANLFMVAQPDSETRYMAVLKSPDNTTEWLVEASQGGQVKLYQIGDLPALDALNQPDKAFQFWTKPPGAKGPTSLGLVQLGKPLELPASALPALVDKQLFEVTLEPAAGSPYNHPTGPILFVGRAVALAQ